MKQAGNCSNCARGVKVKINKDILCKIHGIVSKDFRCARYARRVETWSVIAESKPKCIECEFFIDAHTEKEQDPSIGYCQLFTVRYFNGETKTACSKFCKRSQRNIS